MNAQEALEIITNAIQTYGMTAEQDEALAIAQKALEKQMPKKGFMIGDDYSSVLSCPNCRKPIVNVWNRSEYKPNYCHYCGQALDWTNLN